MTWLRNLLAALRRRKPADPYATWDVIIAHPCGHRAIGWAQDPRGKVTRAQPCGHVIESMTEHPPGWPGR